MLPPAPIAEYPREERQRRQPIRRWMPGHGWRGAGRDSSRSRPKLEAPNHIGQQPDRPDNDRCKDGHYRRFGQVPQEHVVYELRRTQEEQHRSKGKNNAVQRGRKTFSGLNNTTVRMTRTRKSVKSLARIFDEPTRGEHATGMY